MPALQNENGNQTSFQHYLALCFKVMPEDEERWACQGSGALVRMLEPHRVRSHDDSWTRLPRSLPQKFLPLLYPRLGLIHHPSDMHLLSVICGPWGPCSLVSDLDFLRSLSNPLLLVSES